LSSSELRPQPTVPSVIERPFVMGETAGPGPRTGARIDRRKKLMHHRF
jgi:hypothetical protein